MRTMSHHSSLAVLLMITTVISFLFCLGYFIGGLNAMYVAKALAESDSTSLPDISRRLGNGFFYFKIAGVFLVVFLASAYAVWHKAKSSHAQEPRLKGHFVWINRCGFPGQPWAMPGSCF